MTVRFTPSSFWGLSIFGRHSQACCHLRPFALAGVPPTRTPSLDHPLATSFLRGRSESRRATPPLRLLSSASPRALPCLMCTCFFFTCCLSTQGHGFTSLQCPPRQSCQGEGPTCLCAQRSPTPPRALCSSPSPGPGRCPCTNSGAQDRCSQRPLCVHLDLILSIPPPEANTHHPTGFWKIPSEPSQGSLQAGWEVGVI